MFFYARQVGGVYHKLYRHSFEEYCTDGGRANDTIFGLTHSPIFLWVESRGDLNALWLL
jgi:hypothetical protein